MPCPGHIIDSLECVLTVFFSNARHNLRAAYILCDSLVETSCREKIKVTAPNPGRQSYHWHLAHATVGLDPTHSPLGGRLTACHTIRNDLQHNTPSLMPDNEHCADAIKNLVECIEHCFPGSIAAFPDKIRVLLRILGLYGQHGDPVKKGQFFGRLTTYNWRGDQERARITEMIVQPGQRANWSLVIPSEYARLELILNEVGAP